MRGWETLKRLTIYFTSGSCFPLTVWIYMDVFAWMLFVYEKKRIQLPKIGKFDLKGQFDPIKQGLPKKNIQSNKVINFNNCLIIKIIAVLLKNNLFLTCKLKNIKEMGPLNLCIKFNLFYFFSFSSYVWFYIVYSFNQLFVNNYLLKKIPTTPIIFFW